MNGKRYIARVLRELHQDRRSEVVERGIELEEILKAVSTVPSPMKEELFVSLLLDGSYIFQEPNYFVPSEAASIN